MTARVLAHPLRGWGLRNASFVPIHPAELAGYLYAGPGGIYPHNQWLELWVELGALGAALGLAFALLVLRRVRRLPASMRPFAYAAFASAMTIASVNYEVVTDFLVVRPGGERPAVRATRPAGRGRRPGGRPDVSACPSPPLGRSSGRLA